MRAKRSPLDSGVAGWLFAQSGRVKVRRTGRGFTLKLIGRSTFCANLLNIEYSQVGEYGLGRRYSRYRNMSKLLHITEQELLSQLIQALHQVPDAGAELDSVQARAGDGRIDAIVNARVGGNSVRLVVECKKEVFPRDVRQLVWQLRDYVRAYDNGILPWVPVIAAGAISPGARDILRNEGVGYYDAGGSLYLPAPGAFVFVDKPSTKRAERKAVLIFRGQRSQVLHAVWERRHNWFGVHELAKLAHVAPATASETLVDLERRGWVTARGAGPAKERHLDDPRGLLDTWAEYQCIGKVKLKKYFLPDKPVQRVMARFDRACEQSGVLYAVTGEAAGQAYAAYLSSISQVRCRMMPGSAAEDALRVAGARPVDEGWNLGIIDAIGEGEFAFRQRGEFAWLASPLQTWLDLQQGTGRSRDMADHLREELLQ